jgi:hypothetical protein
VAVSIPIAKPSKTSQSVANRVPSQQDSEKPLVRRDSSFMRSVMDELSLSSQSSEGSSSSVQIASSNVTVSSKLTASNSAIRSSTPLKRPSNALGNNNDINRDENRRQRTTLSDTFGHKPLERLTLPHSGYSKQKNQALSASSQVRTIRTVSRFFLSPKPSPNEEQPPAQENVSINSFLTAQNGLQADKVLQGVKSKFAVELEVRRDIMSHCLLEWL